MKCDPTQSKKEITKQHHLFVIWWSSPSSPNRYMETKAVHLDFDLPFPKGQMQIYGLVSETLLCSFSVILFYYTMH